MSIAYLAQAGQQQQLERPAGGTMSILLDSEATKGQLLVARSHTNEGVASPYHMHTREDEVFMMISGTAQFWCGEEESELAEGGIISAQECAARLPHHLGEGRHDDHLHARRERGPVPLRRPRPCDAAT